MFEEDKMLHKFIGYALFCLTGIGFFFCLLFGCELQKNQNIDWTGSTAILFLPWVLIGGIFLGGALCFLFYKLGPLKEPKRLTRNTGDAKWFWISVLVLFLAWIPYFLAYYPGICAYDAVTQIGQIETGEYVEHHPLAHTLFIRICLFLGKLIFHNANAGVAIYSLIQMFALALAFGYCILTVRRYGLDDKWQIALLVIFAIYPFSGYLSVSMTKDILFTVFFVFGLLSFIQMAKPMEDRLKPESMDLVFVVSSVGMILFRNNGKYALLVLTIALLAMAITHIKKQNGYWRLFLDCVAAFVIGILLLSALSRSVNAVQADRREMLSMPIQQLSRCMLYHGGVGILPEDDNTMSEEDKALISELFMGDGYENYLPFISDPVKNKTLTSVVRYQPKRFLTTYFRLLFKYPGDFVNAGLALDAGYLNPEDTTHSKVYQVMYPDMEGKGYVQTWWWESVVEKTGITHDSKLKSLHEMLEKYAGNNSYLTVPVLKYIFVPGIWIWWILGLFLTALIRKDKGMCLALLLVLGYFGTLILGPVVQLRYIYPCMIVTPILTMIMYAKGRLQW